MKDSHPKKDLGELIKNISQIVFPSYNPKFHDTQFLPIFCRRCLKEGNGRTHFIRKAAIGRIMRNIRENQILLSAKLPRAYILEQRELKINPIEYAKYIQVSIQTKGDGSQELIMKTNKPFQREGNVTIEVIADASENVFTYELRTNLYISRLPFTLDMIGHD